MEKATKTVSKNITKKVLTALTIFVTATMLFSGVSSASSVHLKGGKKATPVFYDGGLTLTASGALAGLGNGDVEINLMAQGSVTAVCINPSGKNQPPGQNPAPVSLSGSTAIPDSQIKNGTTSFSVTTTSPGSTIPGAPDCPNGRWTERIVDISFTSAIITVEQGGATVLTISCTFGSGTSNGGVRNVSCR